MKVLIAPTDFSKASINSVNYAADMAFAIKAQLMLFHVVQFEEELKYIGEELRHKMQLLKGKLQKKNK